MQTTVRDQLLNLNQKFYENVAGSFSSTRYAIQPGVRMLLPDLLQAAVVVDLGCGNGNLALSLLKAGFTGSYLGLDNSRGLLDEAEALRSTQVRFAKVDLADMAGLEFNGRGAQAVTSFAVLHHLPGRDLHATFFKAAARLLSTAGRLYISCWQVLNSPRLAKRVLPWSTIGLNPSELEENDLLLDWKAEPGSDEKHFRYVHQFSVEELISLGQEAGLELQRQFLSDGREGDLGLYQVWHKN